jgi:hypothetical protein
MDTKRESSAIKPGPLAAYDRLIGTVPGVVRKGASIPYTSVNGNMFSYLFDKGSLALRLSPADRTAFQAQFRTRLHEAYGIVQKEYVDVPDPVLDDTALLGSWFAASHAYASGLRPKPTTRRSTHTPRPERQEPDAPRPPPRVAARRRPTRSSWDSPGRHARSPRGRRPRRAARPASGGRRTRAR